MQQSVQIFFVKPIHTYTLVTTLLGRSSFHASFEGKHHLSILFDYWKAFGVDSGQPTQYY